MDLIWKPVKGLIRFVAVEVNGRDRCVLMSSSLELSAEEIITIYGLRFKIESSFNEQKNDMGCFSYRFWTTALPKKRKREKSELSSDFKSQTRVVNAKSAIESYVCLTTIATGIITIIAFTHNHSIWKRYPGWIRTLRTDIPSIAVTKVTLAQDLPAFLRYYSWLPMCRIVNGRRRPDKFLYEDVA